MPDVDDGGPAFPAAWENDGDLNLLAPDGKLVPPMTVHHMHGMSLRDYLAAKAMQGVILACDEIADAPPEAKWAAVSTVCYRIADAMLEARKA